jgi:Mrp family chromosome partitioning ATPase
MDLLEYLRTFRRRWPVIVATVVVATIAAWFTTETIAPVATSRPTYSASTVLTSDVTSIGGLPGDLSSLAFMTTIPPVVERAAKELGFEGDPLVLQARIVASVGATDSTDRTGSFLTITSVAGDPERAERTADAFVRALIDFLSDRRERHRNTTVEALTKDIQEANEAGDVETVASLRAQLDFFLSESTGRIRVSVLYPAIAEEVQTTEFTPPDSSLLRLLIAALIGLLAGAGLALVLERVDTKVRTSEQATERFGYPVLAEIPSIRRDQRKGVVTADHPTSSSADAFRLLGAGVHVAVRPRSEDESPERGRIVLVTSPGPAEGKSTVVANLAAALAEEGKKVIVFSADLRRPTLHLTLGADKRPGLVQAARDHERGVRRYKQFTRLNRVSFVPSGGHAERPGEVLASPRVVELLREASTTADWVVVDTAPILVAGESAPLIAEADLVLIVARSGTTSNPVAERTRETLHRIGADAAWVVLNDSPGNAVPAGYRRYQVSSEQDATGPLTGMAPR